MENTIYIHNSLTRKKDKFLPINPPQVKMYVCGPTVYDQPHIGHARSAYIFDVIRRYLTYKGYKVNFVRNVTDVDDKIIQKAKEEYKGEELNSAAQQVAKKYLDAYHEDMQQLGILPPDKEPKATEYIPAMQKFIQELIKRDAAYASGGDVYFDIKKAKDYGKLSHQALDKMEAGARIAPGEKKKDPLDFALWKAAKENEPSWDSPWGKGRPGWHIECSVMSSDILGDEFDIHGGGLDLIFPHHENEIAQSEGAGKKFARYWIHHGLLTINGQKMSKSLGNFITVKGFMEKYKDVDLLKLLFLSTHYLHPVDFTKEKIEEARKQKKDFDEFFYKVNNWGLLEKRKEIEFSNADKAKIDNLCLKFQDAMNDDFNTPQALACLFELIDSGSRFVSADKEKAFNYINNKIQEFFNMLGIRVKSKKEIAKEGIEKVKERDLAKRNKDFKKADLLRNEIKSKFNYIVIDTGTNATIIPVESDENE